MNIIILEFKFNNNYSSFVYQMKKANKKLIYFLLIINITSIKPSE